MDATLQALDDILADRLSGLSREARHIAGLISIFQDGVPCRLLLELMNRDDRRLTAGLEELRERGIIEECRDSRDSLYRFAELVDKAEAADRGEVEWRKCFAEGKYLDALMNLDRLVEEGAKGKIAELMKLD